MQRMTRETIQQDENTQLQLPKIRRHPSLAEIVVDTIREEILAGHLEPGQKIPQDQVAAQLGISRVPLREALHRLEAEGVVNLQPHVGFVVTKLTFDELEDLYATREVIEGAAGRLSAERISEDELARVESLIKEWRKAPKAPKVQDLGKWMVLDREFHMALYTPCRLPRLMRIINDFWNATQGYRRAYTTLPGALEAATATHVQLLDAFRRRDSVEAERLIAGHLRNTVETISRHRDEMKF